MRSFKAHNKPFSHYWLDLFKSHDTSICIANLWRTSIAKASKTGEWLESLDLEEKRRILSTALSERSAVEKADKTCNTERILEYLPEPTEATGEIKFWKILFIESTECKLICSNGNSKK